MANKILITPKSFYKYQQKPLEMLKAAGYDPIVNTTGQTYSEEEMVEFVKGSIAGIIVGVDPLPAAVLNHSSHLRAISKYGVGMDNIDLERAKELSIGVKNAVGANSISVAELAIGLMFECSRKLSHHINEVKNTGWDRLLGFELTGKRLAVIGGGQIGKEVAKRAKGLQMEVSIYDPYFKDISFLQEYDVELAEELATLLELADVISLHLPVTNDTKHLIGKQMLARMKPHAILINTARGELVDEGALYEALSAGHIGAAAQDVYSKEPPEQGDRLIALPNFILTPHLGAFTEEAIERMAVRSTENLLELLKGEG